MILRQLPILLALMISAAPVVAQTPANKRNQSKLTEYVLKGSSGPLTYEGKAKRKIAGGNYEYSIDELKLTSTSTENAAGEVVVKEIVLTMAIKPAEVKGPSKVMLRVAKPMSMVVKKDAPVTAAKVTLVAPKDVLDACDDVTITLTDGKKVWPISLSERKAEDASKPATDPSAK